MTVPKVKAAFRVDILADGQTPTEPRLTTEEKMKDVRRSVKASMLLCSAVVSGAGDRAVDAGRPGTRRTGHVNNRKLPFLPAPIVPAAGDEASRRRQTHARLPIVDVQQQP